MESILADMVLHKARDRLVMLGEESSHSIGNAILIGRPGVQLGSHAHSLYILPLSSNRVILHIIGCERVHCNHFNDSLHVHHER